MGGKQGKEGEKAIMGTATVEMKTEVIGTETQTFEIRRTWDEAKNSCLIVELYPTITIKTTDIAMMDLSTMYVLQHLSELGDYGQISICNLFSKVCTNGKPSAKSLAEDSENISYIEDILESKKTEDFPVILAWGNSLAKNKTTIDMKKSLLELLIEKGYEEKTFCITTDEFLGKSDEKCDLFHPLFLGIRAKKDWKLCKIAPKDLLKDLSPLDVEISGGTAEDADKQMENSKQKANKKRGRKKNDTPKDNAGL